MEFWHVVGDITILLSVAVLLGILAERLGLSGVVGYLVAGIIVGPGLLDWVSSDEESIRSIAEIGVSLLLFTIGLEVNASRFKMLVGKGMTLGVLQVLVTGGVAFGISTLFGLDPKSSIIIGAMVALSSTAVVSRVLQDRSELDAVHGRGAFSVLLIQDIALVPLMILVAFFGETSEETRVATQIGIAGGKIVMLLVVLFILGVLILPRFFGAALIRRSSEFPVILGTVTCLSTMWLAHILDLSPALGAFIAGMLLAGSPFAAQVRGDMAPLKYIFLTLFFAATGMLADLPWLFTGNHFILVIGLVVAIIFGKTIIIWILGIFLGQPRRIAIATGLCLAQIGEFSFVIGAEALQSSILSDHVFQLLMSASLMTLLFSPFLIGKARNIAKSVDSLLGSDDMIETTADTSALQNHVIVIGYGVAGQRIVPDLIESGQQVVVVDMGQAGVQRAKKDGAIGLLGNAQRRDVLMHAGIMTAQLCVLALPDYRASEQTIHQIRACSSSIPIVARARYSIHADQLSTAGADVVVDEEESVGYRLLRNSLKKLGL